ncbi:type IV toxin-antitoxin system AbiEi family antitoxin domain-containing protein [Bacteroides ovatus]|uniref:type IV toxin-antitoxin system AbiEi family antitoxin domain-containing protein n=1 Tax=Bacteroides ovatus TaxID=28116 RepID=UPI00202E398D|nr:type IV toxin-antitoxin system AbiEi family antitoxin [Bacteroides ovatus]MCM1722062.1 type IV toxin-antitoxin system AbiEi family antitoxin [Bacteroides ovatus]MCM1757547.1 type IV toxin-antitoxin system AbiEi family antitoxin [Bacteroides ovatus]MCM1868671.1 type IV toxin-antitoxin system AbiEi family antitoxin [Bacteroides ovatus]MCM1912478.1 type IV toxin-antitoxin system AbiEi family antitoxin [Bacteroides ovatus]
MTIREWIREKEISGSSTFSVEELRSYFTTSSEQVIKNELYRLKMQGRVLSVYKGFYVIVPIQYAAKRIVPPIYYIEQLMKFLKKPYYICLLNAAELLGAAHQRPQRFSVMTILPKSSVSETKNNLLNWIYRKQLPERLLQEKNSETGTILFSNPELTAIDLVQYEQYVGGLSRASTVLAELVEKTNFSNAAEDLFDNTSIATIQRLGYILDCILNESEQADILYEQLRIYDKRLNYRPLSSYHPRNLKNVNKRWKIIVNTNIEIDEL